MKKEGIVKREGHEEKFDKKKVYASCYSACLSTKMEKEEAEKICEKVSKQVKSSIIAKACVTSDQIFKKTTSILNKYDKDAAFMYKTHRDIN